MKVSFGLLVLKLVRTADVTVESIVFDASIDICNPADPDNLVLNEAYCPALISSNEELLCRLFSIVPKATNVNDLQASTTLLDVNKFDLDATIVGAEADRGNDPGIITVVDNGCRSDQCKHADGVSTSAVTFEYDGVESKITATCACPTKETADSNAPADDPFKCKCDDTQDSFFGIVFLRLVAFLSSILK